MKLSIPTSVLGQSAPRLTELAQTFSDELSAVGERIMERLVRVGGVINENEAVQEARDAVRASAERATEEIDLGLSKLGLMRLEAHEAEVARMKKKQQSLRKAAVTRALKKAGAKQ